MGSAGNLLFLIVGGAIVSGVVYFTVVKPKSAAAISGATPAPGVVVWDPSKTSDGLIISGSNITKTGQFDGWTQVGSVSTQIMNGNGYVKLIAPSVNPRSLNIPPGFSNFPISRGSLVFGITTKDQIQDVTSIDYGIKLNDDGSYQIVENGATVLDPNYSPGDDLRVQVIDNQVTYLQNGNVIYVSQTPLSSTWKAAVAIFTSGQQINKLEIQGQPA